MGSKINIIQRIKKRKLNLVGHIVSLEDNRLVKEVHGVRRDGRESKTGKTMKRMVGRCINERYNEEIHILKRKAQDRDAWKKQPKCALDTNGF